MMESREGDDVEAMLTAARLNWRLWTILQADLLAPECTVPDEVRGHVLSLAQFVDRHTLDVIAVPRAEKLDVLIAINRELAGGLYTRVPAGGGEGESSTATDPGHAESGNGPLTVSA